MGQQDFIQELKYWMEKAREADPKFQVFGSETHKYRFEKPVSLEKVRAFEEKHRMKLPENYVRVLTELGNGGAGPYYGLHSLEKLYGVGYTDEFWGDAEETFIDASLTLEAWKAWNEMMRKLDLEADDAVYENMVEKVAANALVIGTQGCTYDCLLMCGGSEQGKIVYFDENLEEDAKPIFTHMTFEEWMLGFFKEVAAGNDVGQYGCIRLGTESEMIEEYERESQQGIHGRRDEAVASLYRFAELSPDTIKRLVAGVDDEAAGIVMSLLFKFDVGEALKMFDAYFYGEHPEIAVQVCRWMPEKEKERYYLRAVELLNTPEFAGRLIWNGAFQKEEPCAERMLFFLDDCRCKRAADIVNYALAAETPKECRRTAIFVMSHCADIADFKAEMAAWMRDEDYWIAHAALQGSIDAKLKGKVIRETYRWMRKRYKDDSTMQANLAHVAWVI